MAREEVAGEEAGEDEKKRKGFKDQVYFLIRTLIINLKRAEHLS